MGFFETHWTKQVPMQMDRNWEKATELEQLRNRLGLSHKQFAGLVMSSAGYFRTCIGTMAAAIKNEFGAISDKQMVAAVAVLFSHLDLEKTKGLFSIEVLVAFMQRFRRDIDSAIRQPGPVLEEFQAKSLDALAARLFMSIGTYERCPAPIRELYSQVDAVYGWRYRLDYDELWDGIGQIIDQETEKKRIIESFMEAVTKVRPYHIEECVDRVSAGEDFVEVAEDLSTRLGVPRDAFILAVGKRVEAALKTK